MAFRTGRSNIDLKSLTDFKLFQKFIATSIGIKLYIGLMILIILGLIRGLNIPGLTDFFQASILAKMFLTISVVYEFYIMGLAVGINRFSFWKMLLIKGIPSFVVAYLGLLYFPEYISNIWIGNALIGIIYFIMFAIIFYPKQITLQDGIVSYILISILSTIASIVVLGITEISFQSTTNIFSII